MAQGGCALFFFIILDFYTQEQQKPFLGEIQNTTLNYMLYLLNYKVHHSSAHDIGLCLYCCFKVARNVPNNEIKYIHGFKH